MKFCFYKSLLFQPFCAYVENETGIDVGCGIQSYASIVKSIVILPAIAMRINRASKPRSRKKKCVRYIYYMYYINGRWYKSVNLPPESDPHRSRAPIRDRRSIDQVKQTTIMRRRINCSVLRAIQRGAPRHWHALNNGEYKKKYCV